ncbi:uncharacterized protein LOC118152298 [Callithrix jacchus]|uniref:uncharacterized protein LOC118152298 n=1 Tax=Callithrix jacchus TaxID=9483 RepID=UPI00159D5113|nr:uncharacterized protein LOC118152298 [Callithrix jacchus]
MAPAGTQGVKWGEDTGAVREPTPAAGRASERGRRERRGIRVWAEASSGALGRFVTLAGPKETSRFRASTRDCPRSGKNENKTFTHLQGGHTPLRGTQPLVLRWALYRIVHVSRIKGRGYGLKARVCAPLSK